MMVMMMMDGDDCGGVEDGCDHDDGDDVHAVDDHDDGDGVCGDGVHGGLGDFDDDDDDNFDDVDTPGSRWQPLDTDVISLEPWY